MATSANKLGSAKAGFATLPQPLVTKLQALIRRVRRVALIRGLFITLAVVGASALAIMAIDLGFTIFSDGFRRLLSLLALGAALATAYFHIWRPLRRQISLTEVARAVEGRHPELEERISSAVELLSSEDSEELRGSGELLSKLVHSATLDARSLLPQQEFSIRRALKPLLATGAALGVVLVAFSNWPGGTGRLLTRAFAPFLQTDNAYADRLSVEPGDARVAEGATLRIEVATTDRKARHTELRRRIPGSQEAVERMTIVEPASAYEGPGFSLTFPAVGESFEYRIRSGRALSRYYRVTVVPRPRIEEFRITRRYPAYTGLAAEREAGPGSDIVAVVGSSVRIEAVLDRPVTNATLLVDGAAIWNSEQRLDGQRPVYSWDYPISDGLDGSWSVQLEDAEGISNKPEEFSIRAIADAPPSVRINSPSNAGISVKPTEILPIGFVAGEDFGIAETQLIVSIAGSKLPPMGVELPARLQPGGGTWAGGATLDLRKLDLGGVRSLEAQIRVADNRPDSAGGPQQAFSEPITIALDSNARSLLEQTVANQQEELQQALWAAMEKLMAAKLLAEDKPGALVENENPSTGVLLEIQEVGILASEAEGIVREASEAVTRTLFADLGPPLAALATDHIEAARAAAESIALTDRSIGRVHKARIAVRELEEGIADLQLILHDMRKRAERARTAAELGSLEDRTRQLTGMRDRQTDPERRENIQEQINELQQLAENIMERSGRSLAEQLNAAGETARQLADRAGELGQDQDQLAEMLAQADDPAQRENLIVSLIRWLQAEQADIARDAAALRDFVKSEPGLDISLDAVSREGNRAADALAQNLFEQAARHALGNADALAKMRSQVKGVPEELQHLAAWQRSIAQQISALGLGDLDAALSEMQEELAEQAAGLAEQAREFRDEAQDLADARAAEAAMQAAEQISQAARSAAQASSQLGGQAGGLFQFSDRPEQFAANENQPPGPPPPSRAGADGRRGTIAAGENLSFQEDEPPPDLSGIGGTASRPIEPGEIALEQIPPALEENSPPQGGALPPGFLANSSQDPDGSGQTSGRSSATGGASGSGSSAGSGLGSAAEALSGASASLTAQATTPMAQQQPDPMTPEIAQQRMEELAQQIASQKAPQPEGSSQDWARIGGQARSGIASASRSQPPAEYRDLVKRYHEEIARRSGEAENSQP